MNALRDELARRIAAKQQEIDALEQQVSALTLQIGVARVYEEAMEEALRLSNAYARRGRLTHRPASAVRGELAPNVKLNRWQVLDIRYRHGSTGESFNSLAKAFGVSAPTIAAIVHGDTWKHLPLDPRVYVAEANQPQEPH